MQKRPDFDYNQPSRTTLAGVNVEVSDTDRDGILAENTAPVNAAAQAALQSGMFIWTYHRRRGRCQLSAISK